MKNEDRKGSLARFKKISEGGIKGRIREDLLPFLPSAFFRDPVSFVSGAGGELIRESKLRWAALFSLPNGYRIFAKRDRTKGWGERLKYLILPSKAQKEWVLALQLEKRRIRIPRPLGWFENVSQGFVTESFYLAEALGAGTSAMDEPGRLKEDPTLEDFARTVRKIHGAGLYHGDFHAGNFLWHEGSLFLTDLHSARLLKTVSLDQRLWNLAHLFHSLRTVWEEKEQSRFVCTYFEGDPAHLSKSGHYLRRIHERMERLLKRQWRSRTKRCLKESTDFSIPREGEVRYYHRRDLPLNQVKRILEKHRTLVVESPSRLIKYSPEVVVSMIEDGRKVVVKEFRYPHLRDRLKDRFRRSKGLKAWIAGNGLQVRRIVSVKPLALMEGGSERGGHESFLVMEALEDGQELDRYLLRGFKDFNEKRRFIQSCAAWLAHLHQHGISHKDMKTCNIMACEKEKSWNFYLLDLEDVALNETVREKGLFRSLLQLNTSTPRIITRTDRLRFFEEYLRKNPVVSNPRRFLERLIEESHKRGLVYVSPQGVVVESF
jgi:tRNA A-37 threonylcarbamoyl transferase component Bud32